VVYTTRRVIMTIRPAILGVLQRIEYRYGNKEQLIAPKLDGPVRYGTLGAIEITVIFYYPSIPGKLYHPINNWEEAEWWLNFYGSQVEFVSAIFRPAPDGRETGTFAVPDLGEFTIDEPVDWYSSYYNADEYTL
jgi:acylphosphatase